MGELGEIGWYLKLETIQFSKARFEKKKALELNK